MNNHRKFSDFSIILIEPKYSGNIGAVARTMMNFDFQNLYLVNPCEINDECYARAMHAQQIIENARIFTTFDEIIPKFDYLVATSSIDTKSDKKHLRNPLTPDEFAEKIFEIKGAIGLVFGREDYGLYNEEIAACDIMLKIPTSDIYPSLNLSHAVSLVLYSLYIHHGFAPRQKRKIDHIEKEKLEQFFSSLLEEINYPEHKKENTKIMFKRIMGRAMLSKWEYHTFMGVLGNTVEKIQKKIK